MKVYLFIFISIILFSIPAFFYFKNLDSNEYNLVNDSSTYLNNESSSTYSNNSSSNFSDTPICFDCLNTENLDLTEKQLKFLKYQYAFECNNTENMLCETLKIFSNNHIFLYFKNKIDLFYELENSFESKECLRLDLINKDKVSCFMKIDNNLFNKNEMDFLFSFYAYDYHIFSKNYLFKYLNIHDYHDCYSITSNDLVNKTNYLSDIFEERINLIKFLYSEYSKNISFRIDNVSELNSLFYQNNDISNLIFTDYLNISMISEHVSKNLILNLNDSIDLAFLNKIINICIITFNDDINEVYFKPVLYDIGVNFSYLNESQVKNRIFYKLKSEINYGFGNLDLLYEDIPEVN